MRGHDSGDWQASELGDGHLWRYCASLIRHVTQWRPVAGRSTYIRICPSTARPPWRTGICDASSSESKMPRLVLSWWSESHPDVTDSSRWLAAGQPAAFPNPNIQASKFERMAVLYCILFVVCVTCTRNAEIHCNHWPTRSSLGARAHCQWGSGLPVYISVSFSTTQKWQTSRLGTG